MFGQVRCRHRLRRIGDEGLCETQFVINSCVPFGLLVSMDSSAGIAMLVIEDEIHCDWHGQYVSFDDAVAELRLRATLPWDQPPNVAPCVSWRTCGREYVIIEVDDSQLPWKELRRVPVFEVSASGVKWSSDFTQN
jgi:hypothetical protein